MYVTKCDICKKQVKEKAVVAGVDFPHSHFCEKCGKPVLKFLNKHNLTKETKEIKR